MLLYFAKFLLSWLSFQDHFLFALLAAAQCQSNLLNSNICYVSSCYRQNMHWKKVIKDPFTSLIYGGDLATSSHLLLLFWICCATSSATSQLNWLEDPPVSLTLRCGRSIPFVIYTPLCLPDFPHGQLSCLSAVPASYSATGGSTRVSQRASLLLVLLAELGKDPPTVDWNSTSSWSRPSLLVLPVRHPPVDRKVHMAFG